SSKVETIVKARKEQDRCALQFAAYSGCSASFCKRDACGVVPSTQRGIHQVDVGIFVHAIPVMTRVVELRAIAAEYRARPPHRVRLAGASVSLRYLVIESQYL